MDKHDDSAGIPARYRRDWVRSPEAGEKNALLPAKGPSYSTPSAVDLAQAITRETRRVQGLKWQWVMGYEGNNLHVDFDKVFRSDKEIMIKAGEEMREHDAQFPGLEDTLTEPDDETVDRLSDETHQERFKSADNALSGSFFEPARKLTSRLRGLEEGASDTPSKAGDRSHQMKEVCSNDPQSFCLL